MISNSLFISYGHRDLVSTNWVEQLKLYLAALRRQQLVEIWDDGRIRAGQDWRAEIKAAIDRAAVAILLIGPGFMASDFIAEHELPDLLEAAKTRGVKIYPLIVGYCNYKQSVLERYQAFNQPDLPLEALPTAEQNRILNALSLAVDEDLRHAQSAVPAMPAVGRDLYSAMSEISRHIAGTHTAFAAQCRRRNDLVQTLRKRLAIKKTLEYEKFFLRYYDRLNAEERFEFDQIRAITEGPMYLGNQALLDLIEQSPEVTRALPELGELRQHLVFWLNKYERVFLKRPQMCLLYAGVEDGVPFPPRLGAKVKSWLAAHAPAAD